MGVSHVLVCLDARLSVVTHVFRCFVGPISDPLTSAEKHFTSRQESRRKDVERAFLAIQCK